MDVCSTYVKDQTSKWTKNRNKFFNNRCFIKPTRVMYTKVTAGMLFCVNTFYIANLRPVKKKQTIEFRIRFQQGRCHTPTGTYLLYK